MDSGVQLTSVIREALRASLPSDENAFVTSSEEKGDLREVIAAILFTRRFIAGYNLLLLVGLVLVTCWRWGGKFALHLRRSQQAGGKEDLGNDTDIEHIAESDSVPGDKQTHTRSVRSSSSSDVSEASSSTAVALCNAKKSGETQPLLQTSRSSAIASKSRFSRASANIRSWLMYQPRNIPVINKVLPTYLTTIAIVLFFGLQLFFLFYHTNVPPFTFFIFGERTGLLFAGNLPLLFLLAAKNCPIRPLTGLSYENLNILHRRLGEFMSLLALFHFIAMLLVYATTLATRGLTFIQFLRVPIIWLGISAFSCYELLYLTSLSSFRQRCYELFLASHIILQAAGLGFLYFHHHAGQPYILFALAIFLLDRLVFRLYLRRTTLKADLTILPDGETLLLSSSWPISKRKDIRSGWSPSDHVFISIPALAKRHLFQSHPFTIASAAPDMGPDKPHAWFDLLIRARDGFTGDLLRYAETHHRVDVVVDGPYGSHHALDLLRTAEVAVFVAGGSGIAVGYPLIWDLARRKIVGKRIVLVWIVHQAGHLQWLGMERIEDLRGMGVEVVLPPPTEKLGRPDIKALVEDAVGVDERKSIGLVVSGPDGMNRSARNVCAGLVKRGWNIDVAVEKFGW